MPHCSAEFGWRNKGSKVILDHIACPAQTNLDTLQANVRTLATKLSHADPGIFGLLRCKGVVEHEPSKDKPNAFTLVFRIDSEFSEPRSLRDWLLDSDAATLGFQTGGLESRDPLLVKDRLLSMTRELLPRRMGTIYADAVETCLTCLDDDNDGIGNERELAGGDVILVGVRYIKVCLSQSINKTAILTPLRSSFGSTASVFDST